MYSLRKLWEAQRVDKDLPHFYTYAQPSIFNPTEWYRNLAHNIEGRIQTEKPAESMFDRAQRVLDLYQRVSETNESAAPMPYSYHSDPPNTYYYTNPKRFPSESPSALKKSQHVLDSAKRTQGAASASSAYVSSERKRARRQLGLRNAFLRDLGVGVNDLQEDPDQEIEADAELTGSGLKAPKKTSRSRAPFLGFSSVSEEEETGDNDVLKIL